MNSRLKRDSEELLDTAVAEYESTARWAVVTNRPGALILPQGVYD